MNTVRPSETQKQIIALIIAAPTPRVAGDDISQTPNLVAARDILAKLGMINFDMGNAELTEAGSALAVDQNIADESGMLTDYGTQLVGSNNQQNDQTTNDDTVMPTNESFKFLRELLKIV